MRKAAVLLIAAGSAAFALVGCGDLGTSIDGIGATIDSVRVSPSEVTLPPGQTADLTVDFRTTGGPRELTVQWSSGDSGVASVEASGARTATVTGVAEGNTTVTATVEAINVREDATASADVTVTGG